MFSDVEIKRVGEQLVDSGLDICERARAMFTLENVGGVIAESYLIKCLDTRSELLSHEAAYCCGQLRSRLSLDALKRVLADPLYPPIVRHEAAEALGAVGDPAYIEFLKSFINDPIEEVGLSCLLAAHRIESIVNRGDESGGEIVKSPFNRIDPVEATNSVDIALLEKTFTDSKISMIDRYKAMFNLRNLNTPQTVQILHGVLDRPDESPLLKHEIGYVLGQLRSDLSIELLKKIVSSETEHPMVRHECAIALGNYPDDECLKLLENYSKHPEPLVSESCLVALDMAESEKKNEFQYANKLC